METYSLLYDERFCCDHNHPFLIEGMYLMKKIGCALLYLRLGSNLQNHYLPQHYLVRLRPLPDDSLGALGLPVRLLWPSLQPRVCESSSLSNWFFPFRGPTPISCLFLSWRPRRSRSLIPSLAPSWWCPCPLMRWALLTLSGYVLSVPSAFSLRRSRWSIPFALSPLLRIVFADGFRHL